MYCDNEGKVDAKCLSPCQDSLKHAERSNYQAAVWRRALQQNPETPSPVGLGWKRTDNGKIQIKWNSVRPTPEEILGFLSCNCSRDCKATMCP